MLIFNALIPVALIVALGYGLRHTVLKDPGHWYGMEQLTYYVLFPALLVVSGAKADLSTVSFAGVVGAYAITLCILFGLLVVIRPLLMDRMDLSGRPSPRSPRGCCAGTPTSPWPSQTAFTARRGWRSRPSRSQASCPW